MHSLKELLISTMEGYSVQSDTGSKQIIQMGVRLRVVPSQWWALPSCISLTFRRRSLSMCQ
jgi:hypothetical protein